jgi:hypothetical protein
VKPFWQQKNNSSSIKLRMENFLALNAKTQKCALFQQPSDYLRKFHPNSSDEDKNRFVDEFSGGSKNLQFFASPLKVPRHLRRCGLVFEG